MFLGNTEDWCMKDFDHVYCNMITDSSSLYCNNSCMKGNAANGDWETYHIMGEFMHITDLFLDNFIGIVNFLTNFFPSGWEFWMFRNWITRESTELTELVKPAELRSYESWVLKIIERCLKSVQIVICHFYKFYFCVSMDNMSLLISLQPCFVYWRSLFQISTQILTILNDMLCAFSQFTSK
jgi:hypothetical protein